MKNLLVIEDNPGDVRLLREAIRENGENEFSLTHAADLKTGLSVIDKDNIEALLLDLSLPDSAGLDTFLQAKEHAPQIPIIILSGTSDEEFALNAVREGAQDYFVKGQIEPNVLLRALRYAIERNKREQELGVIAEVSGAFRKVMSLEDIFTTTLGRVVELLNISGGMIALLEPNKNVLHIQYATENLTAYLGKELKSSISIMGEIIEAASLYFENDFPASQDARLDEFKALAGENKALTIAPFYTEDRQIGILAAFSLREFDAHDLTVVKTIANLASNNYDRIALFEQTSQRLNRLSSLRAIDLSITTSTDISLTLNVVLEQIINELEVDAAAILGKDENQRLIHRASQGLRTPLIKDTDFRIGEGYAGEAAYSRKLVRVMDLREDPNVIRRELMHEEDFSCYFAYPLLVQSEVIGVVELFHRSPIFPDDEWFDYFATLAGQTAIAIHTADLFANLQLAQVDLELAYDAALEGWVRALDLRDQETEGHTQRVTKLSVELAKRLGFKGQSLVDIRRGTLLHDIGKIGIPDSILHKPDKLSDEEWEVMKLHPVYAKELLSPIKNLERAIEIPYYHHEKWDGSGYPVGLREEEIPISARMFAIVDVWDALSSNRPYRKAWEKEAIVSYIAEQKGSHFDPQIVDHFMELLSDKDLHLN